MGESWSRFPEARARLLDMLLRLRVRAQVLLRATCTTANCTRPRARLEEEEEEEILTRTDRDHLGGLRAWGHRLTTRDIDWPEAHFGPFENLQARLGWMAMHWVQRSAPFVTSAAARTARRSTSSVELGEVAIELGVALAVALRDHRGTARHTASFALDGSAPRQLPPRPRPRPPGDASGIAAACRQRTDGAPGAPVLALLALLGGPMCMLRASCGLRAAGWARARHGDPAKKAQ